MISSFGKQRSKSSRETEVKRDACPNNVDFRDSVDVLVFVVVNYRARLKVKERLSNI